MSFSDILALLEILVTILFGYCITHWVTVRDTRTRSVKDLYISQLSEIKNQVDIFFCKLFEGRLRGRTIADWYGHQQIALTCFDEGLRMALPIRKEKLEDIVNRIHETITGSAYYNDNFNKKKYVLSKDEQVKMHALKRNVDKAFNEYVVQINNSRQYYFWESFKQNYLFDVAYFTFSDRRYPRFDALKIRGFKLLPFFVVSIAVVLIVRSTYTSYRNNLINEQQRQKVYCDGIDKFFEKTDQLNSTLTMICNEITIANRQDSILQQIIVKELEREKEILKELAK